MTVLGPFIGPTEYVHHTPQLPPSIRIPAQLIVAIRITEYHLMLDRQPQQEWRRVIRRDARLSRKRVRFLVRGLQRPNAGAYEVLRTRWIAPSRHLVRTR